jgi:hypothetical protein
MFQKAPDKDINVFCKSEMSMAQAHLTGKFA